MNTPHNTLAERTSAIVRSIASGNNACGTLVDRNGRVNEAFLAASVRPTLDVYEREAMELRDERNRLSRESEERRRILEFVYSNAGGQLPPEVNASLSRALGYARA